MEALELVGTLDQERALFVRKYFNAEWPCRRLYHMMHNSDGGIDFVTQSILNAMDRLEAAQNPPNVANVAERRTASELGLTLIQPATRCIVFTSDPAPR